MTSAIKQHIPTMAGQNSNLICCGNFLEHAILVGAGFVGMELQRKTPVGTLDVGCRGIARHAEQVIEVRRHDHALPVFG